MVLLSLEKEILVSELIEFICRVTQGILQLLTVLHQLLKLRSELLIRHGAILLEHSDGLLEIRLEILL